MRELFLHVGMHKTGTTSIQQTLFDHRPLLQEAGFSYFGAEPNHSRPVFSAFTEEPHLYHINRREGRHEPGPAAAWAEECRAALEAFLARAPGPRLILSGEDIALLSDPATATMLAFLRRHVDRVTVIGFVRPPRSFMTSIFQQRVRGGTMLAEFESGISPGYRRRFKKYLDLAGVDALRLQLYTKEALVGGCSIATFLKLCDAPPELYPRLQVRRMNTASSRLGVLLNLAANEAVPVFLPDGAANPERATQLARFLEEIGGQKLELPPRMLATWLRQAQPDIVWMENALGQRFAPEERRPMPGAPGAAEDFRSLSWEEIQTLTAAINALLLGRRPDPSFRPRPSDPPAAAAPPARPADADREARRAARRLQRRMEGGRAWR